MILPRNAGEILARLRVVDEMRGTIIRPGSSSHGKRTYFVEYRGPGSGNLEPGFDRDREIYQVGIDQGSTSEPETSARLQYKFGSPMGLNSSIWRFTDGKFDSKIQIGSSGGAMPRVEEVQVADVGAELKGVGSLFLDVFRVNRTLRGYLFTHLSELEPHLNGALEDRGLFDRWRGPL